MNHTDVCLNYTYGSSLSIQTIQINHRIILELTKNVGCTSNKAGAPSITHHVFELTWAKDGVVEEDLGQNNSN